MSQTRSKTAMALLGSCKLSSQPTKTIPTTILLERKGRHQRRDDACRSHRSQDPVPGQVDQQRRIVVCMDATLHAKDRKGVTGFKR